MIVKVFLRLRDSLTSDGAIPMGMSAGSYLIVASSVMSFYSATCRGANVSHSPQTNYYFSLNVLAI
jgi:hypothetical protein